MKKLFPILALTVAPLGLSTSVAAETLPAIVTMTPAGPVVNLKVSDSVEVAPDIVRIRIGVISHNKDRALAMQENRMNTDKILVSLKAGGIADKDIETGWFGVSEDLDYSQAGKSRRKGYVVANSFNITVRKLDSLSDLVGAASSAGANDIGSPSYDAENKTPIIEKLTRSGLDKARARAEFHAKLNGYTGVKLLAVADEVQSGGGLGHALYAPKLSPVEAMAESLDEAPTFRPEQVNVSVSLYLTYEMTK